MDPISNRIALGAAGAGKVRPEDVFSVDTYIGNETVRSITTGIDLAGEGGFVLIKPTDESKKSVLFDTIRGATKYMQPGSVAIQTTDTGTLTSFNSDGFSLGTDISNNRVNSNLKGYAALSFRQFEGFLNMITWTGNGATSRTISHSLNSVPELMIVKSYGPYSEPWAVYHPAGGNAACGRLSDVSYWESDPNVWNSTAPTSSVIHVGNDDKTNRTGATYVGFLFSTLVDFCKVGSYTGTGSSQNIDCSDAFTGGPRFVLIKNVNRNSVEWRLYYDIVSANDKYFTTDTNTLEAPAVTNTDFIDPYTSGGFTVSGTDNALNRSGDTYAYIAIK